MATHCPFKTAHNLEQAARGYRVGGWIKALETLITRGTSQRFFIDTFRVDNYYGRAAMMKVFDYGCSIPYPADIDSDGFTASLFLANELGHLVYQFRHTLPDLVWGTSCGETTLDEQSFSWLFAFKIMALRHDRYLRAVNQNRLTIDRAELTTRLMGLAQNQNPKVVRNLERIISNHPGENPSGACVGCASQNGMLDLDW